MADLQQQLARRGEDILYISPTDSEAFLLRHKEHSPAWSMKDSTLGDRLDPQDSMHYIAANIQGRDISSCYSGNSDAERSREAPRPEKGWAEARNLSGPLRRTIIVPYLSHFRDYLIEIHARALCDSGCLQGV